MWAHKWKKKGGSFVFDVGTNKNSHWMMHLYSLAVISYNAPLFLHVHVCIVTHGPVSHKELLYTGVELIQNQIKSDYIYSSQGTNTILEYDCICRYFSGIHIR